MRSYTLSVLSSLNTSNAKVEIEIIKWVNEKLTASGKADSKINSFQDSKIATARPIIDLIDAIKPGVINYELLQENGGTYEVSNVVQLHIGPNIEKYNTGSLRNKCASSKVEKLLKGTLYIMRLIFNGVRGPR